SELTTNRRADADRSRGDSLLIGLMSGTSVDGITAAVARFSARDQTTIGVELLTHVTSPYAVDRQRRLLRAMESADPSEYCRLNFDIGEWLAEAALMVMRRAGIGKSDVAAIASHGHTLWHEPGHSTLQLGEGAVIAERTGIAVVCDFRVRDVAAGGQGAPLVTIADALLFSAGDGWRALQNIGGIANVSIVPPGGALDRVQAFDTGPGCAVIDGVTRALFPSLPYDVDGSLAARGQPIRTVVTEILAQPYFVTPPPKSTGRELFSQGFIERFMIRCREERPGATSEDIIATAVELTARSIGDALTRFVSDPVSEIVVSGGGARNPTLMQAIATALAPRTVTRFAELFFDGEAKEAVAFALLGYLHLLGRPGNVPSATGARFARPLGKWCPA
ncbi:MAG TPA: anhydro-N-acetylmuramic acid kinase, partial [Gemmatimonadaceae bacterium]|nr:anhydro-N-acetylmuramic acid kinase [Gemmatimonadaceae bacterium]